MRYIFWIFFLFFYAAATLSVKAADPKELFGAILGEIEGHIKRRQQRKLRKRLMPFWQACAGGDVEACDTAATFPLNTQNRARLEKLRVLAVGRPGYERNWYACQKMDVAACTKALEYPGASDSDRRSLLGWYDQASEQQLRKQAERQRIGRLETNCLQQDQLASCREVLNSAYLSDASRSAITQRLNLLVDEQRRRQAAEAARRAEQERFDKLRSDCLVRGIKTACVAAAGHRLASHTQRTEFENKQYALTSFSEQVVSSFATAISSGSDQSATKWLPTLLMVALFASAATLVGYAIVLFWRLLASRSARQPAEKPQEPMLATPFAANFTLTGHLPTDVRQVLHGS